MSKDYYKILGVQEDADELVIRASYLALLKRYNLDDWKGDDKQRAIKMLADINEAYSVLKDRHERLEYNSVRQKQQEEEVKPVESSMSDDEVDAAWKVACNYYNDLEVLYFNLFQISEQVAHNFKLSILISKDYPNRNKLAIKLELDYLKSQFGNDQDLVDFGKELILEEVKDAVAELNHVVAVMGNAVHAEDVIDKISKKYQTQRYLNELHKIREEEIRRKEEELKKLKEIEERKKRLKQEEAEAEEGRKEAQKFFFIFMIACAAIFYFIYWYMTNIIVQPQGKQLNHQSSLKKETLSVNSGVSLEKCEDYVALYNKAQEAGNLESAEKYSELYMQCLEKR